MKDNSGHMSVMTDESTAAISADCYEYKKGKYLYMQVCKNDQQETTTFCINHLRNASEVCNVPDHTETILRRYARQVTQSMSAAMFEIRTSCEMPHSSSAFSGYREEDGIETVQGLKGKNKTNVRFSQTQLHRSC